MLSPPFCACLTAERALSNSTQASNSDWLSAERMKLLWIGQLGTHEKLHFTARGFLINDLPNPVCKTPNTPFLKQTAATIIS